MRRSGEDSRPKSLAVPRIDINVTCCFGLFKTVPSVDVIQIAFAHVVSCWLLSFLSSHLDRSSGRDLTLRC